MFLDAGRREVADWLTGTYTHIALGSDDTAVAVTDTELSYEADRVAPISYHISNQSLTVSGLLTPISGNGVTFREIGLLNSGTADTFHNRQIIGSPFVKDETMEIHIRTTIDLK